jgi:hypothetical protein
MEFQKIFNIYFSEDRLASFFYIGLKNGMMIQYPGFDVCYA